MKLQEIASQLGARLDPPDADVEITGLAAIDSAQAGQLAFIANPKYSAAAQTTHASALIVDEQFPALSKPTLRTKNPQFAYARALRLFFQTRAYEPGIHLTAVVHPTARIGKNASIGPYVTIDSGAVICDDCNLLSHVTIYRDVRIGDNFFAHSHVSVREECEIGDNVLLHNGVVIGADGFGFAKDDQGKWYKILQTGKVVVEDDVEIQANASIDRASLGETRIGRGVKIDSFSHVAHNSVVGGNTMLCAQVGLAGSTEIGRNAILAGQVGVAGHCKIPHNVIITPPTPPHLHTPQ